MLAKASTPRPALPLLAGLPERASVESLGVCENRFPLLARASVSGIRRARPPSSPSRAVQGIPIVAHQHASDGALCSQPRQQLCATGAVGDDFQAVRTGPQQSRVRFSQHADAR